MGTLSNLVVKVAADISSFKAGMAQVHNSFDQGGAKATAFGKKVEDASSKAGKSASGLGASFTSALGIAGIATGVLAAGALAAGVASVHMAADFQSSMTALVTGAGESKSNIDLVSKGILSMAGDVGVSADQLASGMYMIESAGYHGAAGLTVLKTAAQGAKVGNADMATVADALTSALNAYHMPASNAVMVTNDLVATVASGKMHMQDLAGALGAVLPAASAAGVSLQQVTGAIATMTMQGTPAADAATYLRQTILQLENPSAKAKTAMKDVGLASDDLAKALRTEGLSGALQMATDAIGKKFAPGSAEYIAHLANMVGGTKSMQAALELTGGNMATFKANVAGITDQVAKGGKSVLGWSDVQGDFNQKLERSKDALMAAGISLGTRLLPVASAFMTNVLIPSLPKLADFAGHLLDAASAAATQLAPAFKTISTDLPPAISAISGAISFLDSHKEILAGVGAAILTMLVPGIVAWTVATWAQVAALAAQAVAMVIAFAPVIAIAIGIGIVVAAVVLLIEHWGLVKSTTLKVWNEISGYLAGVWKSISGTAIGVWNGISNFFKTWGALILLLVGGPIGYLVLLIGQHWQAITAGVTSAWNAITGFLGGVWNGYITLAGTVFNSIVGAITGPLTTLEGELAGIWNSITSGATSAWNSLIGPASSIFAAVGRAIASGISSIHIPMPHLSLGGSHSIDVAGVSVNVPDFGVNWYAKGGIFNGPSVIGVGEKGSEAVLPIDRLRDLMPSPDMGGIKAALDQLPRRIVEELARYHVSQGSADAPARFDTHALAAALFELMQEARTGRKRGHRSLAL